MGQDFLNIQYVCNDEKLTSKRVQVAEETAETSGVAHGPVNRVSTCQPAAIIMMKIRLDPGSTPVLSGVLW